MKIATTDFPRLQLSLFATLLMLAIGATGAYLALKASRMAKLEQIAAQREKNEFEGKLKRVRSEETEIKQKSALFNKLKARGMIGDEQRLEWVELLKAIGERRRLLDLRYEIAPQRRLDAPPGSTLAFYASTMKIQLKLLHEEDLTRLLDDLRQQARALTQVRNCTVSRLPHTIGEAEHDAQLQAECQIDWITVHEADGRGPPR